MKRFDCNPRIETRVMNIGDKINNSIKVGIMILEPGFKFHILSKKAGLIPFFCLLIKINVPEVSTRLSRIKGVDIRPNNSALNAGITEDMVSHWHESNVNDIDIIPMDPFLLFFEIEAISW
ncbi:MAG: hypothetical protein M1535_00210 [Candidatus Thermoplasmatota archaeon]|nr:hypothetical protein [Candidatus Thermoplasmatota archaeon]